MRFTFVTSILALTIAVIPACNLGAQGARVDAGNITEQIAAKTIPVTVQADASELQRLAETAFSAHGAFRVEAGSGAAYRIQFTVTGTSAVRVTVASTRPAQTVLTQDVQGRSLANALLRAADAAVAHLTGRPGFFAGRLTFVAERTGRSEVYVSDLFFREVQQLTSDRAQAVTPRWSPDGKKILYTGYFQSGFPDICQIDLATLQRTILVSLKGTNTGGRFSPDGTRIAMILSGEGNPEVYVGNASGRALRRLTRTERQIEATPSWSPDGTRLVVASDALATGKPQLYLLPVAGGALQRLPLNISGYCAEPDWNQANPDLIAFTHAVGRGFQVGVYSMSQQKARPVTQVSGDGLEPSWTADGRHLVFTARTSSSQRICLLDTETGRVTQLSPTSLGRAYQANYVRN